MMIVGRQFNNITRNLNTQTLIAISLAQTDFHAREITYGNRWYDISP